jgi:hypothetical protein
LVIFQARSPHGLIHLAAHYSQLGEAAPELQAWSKQNDVDISSYRAVRLDCDAGHARASRMQTMNDSESKKRTSRFFGRANRRFIDRDDMLLWLSLAWFVAVGGVAIWVLLQSFSNNAAGDAPKSNLPFGKRSITRSISADTPTDCRVRPRCSRSSVIGWFHPVSAHDRD